MKTATEDRSNYVTVHLPAPDDFDCWRTAARAFIQKGVAPHLVNWVEPGGVDDLFGQSAAPSPEEGLAGSESSEVRVSKRFMSLARNAALHSDPQRFSLLYRILWRLQTNLRLLEDRTDEDVRRLEELDKNV